MKLIFMGTPDFAVPSLTSLIKEHEVVAVFTQPDKPRGRGNKVTFSPVKTVATEHGIPVYQPLNLKLPETHELLRALAPDCIVVAAYGVLLPQAVLDIPKYGCINVHASLLPKYRGAAPINRCIMDGETQTGVTIMQMEKGLDTGDMLLKGAVDITPDMTATGLHDVLAELGGTLIATALRDIDVLVPIKQDDNEATYAAKIQKADCEIDFTRPAEQVCNFIRGLADYPCGYCVLRDYGGKRAKVYRAEIEKVSRASGNVGIDIICGDGETVTLTEIQPDGGKRMRALDFINGYKH